MVLLSLIIDICNLFWLCFLVCVRIFFGFKNKYLLVDILEKGRDGIERKYEKVDEDFVCVISIRENKEL